MTRLTFRQAIKRGLEEALDDDPNVLVMGEDVGRYGGAYAITAGLLKTYGPERILDTPISEASFVGCGIGAAVGGLRPIVELMSINFALVAFDQIVNMAAKIQYMSGGQINVPLVIRGPTGGGMQLGATHSQNLETVLAAVPGLKVVIPATPSDALGLFRSALADPNPVIFAEPARLYGQSGDVSDDHYTVPIGKANVVRPGSDLTLVSYGHGMVQSLLAADALLQRGVDVEVIDLRSLRPLDMLTVQSSVRQTGRAVLFEETWRTGGIMAEIAAELQETCIDHLDGPIIRVAGADAPAPYSRELELSGIPDHEDILQAVAATHGP